MSTIVGIGAWLPERVKLNDEWPAEFSNLAKGGERTFNDIPLAKDAVSARIIERDLAREAMDPFLGAKRRHVSDLSMTAVEAESIAAQRALEEAALASLDVDVVLSNSLVPDRVSPPTATEVAHRIGATNAWATSIDTVCASAITQLAVADALIKSGARIVLCTQSHLLLRAFPEMHPAVPGLGEIATAYVVMAKHHVLKSQARHAFTLRAVFQQTHGEYAKAVTFVRGSDDETDIPWWAPGGGFRLGSRNPLQAKELMRDTVSYAADAIQKACDGSTVPREAIQLIASVQPRGFIPPAIAERLGLDRSIAVTTYEDIAHVGACGPVYNLLKGRDRVSRGGFAALYGQGAGFTRAAAILQRE